MIVSSLSQHDAFLVQLDEFCERVVAAASDSGVQSVDGALRMPHGMCTWASFAGGELLAESGFGTWKIWNATHPDGRPAHDWLVQGALFVDLTAHQFDGFTSHIVGVGESPLTERFPRRQRMIDTSRIVDHPPIVTSRKQSAPASGRGSIDGTRRFSPDAGLARSMVRYDRGDSPPDSRAP